MVVILKDKTSQSDVIEMIEYLDAFNVSVSVTEGEHTTILGLIGDTASLEEDDIRGFDFVEDIKRIQEPYKAANKKFHPEPTIVDLGEGIKIGGGNFQVIAGPCSVESEEQIVEVAKAVKASRRCSAAARSSRERHRMLSRGSERRASNCCPKRRKRRECLS